MPVVILTTRNVLTLAGAPGQRVDFIDSSLPGFMLRVSANNVRSYAVWYRVHGRARRFTLGPVNTISLADAREQARRILAEARAGRDAVAERQRERAAAHKAALLAMTFTALAERYLAHEGPSLAPRTVSAYRNILRADIFPDFGDLPPHEITRPLVRALIEKIRQRAPMQANRAFGILRRVYSWAIEHDLVVLSPCTGLKAPSEKKPRLRVYTNDEIRALLAALPGTAIEHVVPFLFYTATRSEEARSLRWTDIDLERKLWTIPCTKEGQVHVVPLSAGALRVLARLPRGVDFVFPAHTATGFLGFPQRAIQIVRDRSGVADFRLHDVRRTVRTRLSELGVLPDIAERVLGHVLGGIRRVYDRHDYVPQMRAALDLWGEEFDRLTSAAPSLVE